MTNPKVSILLPIYNAQPYLRQCLDSICAQTMSDFEAICINDGSTDSSLETIKEYCSKDSRFKLIDKQNTGYGASMNKGLVQASGDYVAIVEPDDYVESDMLQVLYVLAFKHDLDIAKGNYFEYYDGKDHPIYNMNIKHKLAGVFDPVDNPAILLTQPTIWCAIYKREFIEKWGIIFSETPGAAFQDTGFSLKTWMCAIRCKTVLKPLHHYRCDNPNSSVKTTDKLFTVCDELSAAESFVRENLSEERVAVFMPYFQYDKWLKYKWNLERIESSRKDEFLQYVKPDFLTALNRGELVESVFGKDWAEFKTGVLD